VPRAVVLVEGISDRVAVETLAGRLGRDLGAEEVDVVSVGGAHAIGRFLAGVDAEARVAVLCDAGEEPTVTRAVRRDGVSVFVCEADLEDELIRAHGTDAVEAILAANGDLVPFRTLQKQTAWRGRGTDQQLRRFMGSGARRKTRYARLLVEALDLASMPRPLLGVLEHV
jgi:nitrogen fixation protein